MTEKVLDYNRSIVPQETGFNCGPAATQIVLDALGIRVTEQELAREMETDAGGTDTIDHVVRSLRRLAPAGKYATQWLPNDPPNAQQRQQLWERIVASIDAGYGLVMNWQAPPSNHPKPVPPSTIGPNYGGSTVWHYVACMGYGEDANGRRVWIADSGFYPGGYWIGFDQCATLIPPKGYAYATAAPVAPEPPPPPVTPGQDIDAMIRDVHRESTMRLLGRDATDEQVRRFIASPGGVDDTVLGWAMTAAATARLALLVATSTHDMAARIANKAGVDVADLDIDKIR